MHWNCWLGLALMLSMTACASRRDGGRNQDFPVNQHPVQSPGLVPAPVGSGQNSGSTIVTPGAPKVGRISLVNGSARYVIVTFSIGQLPVRDARLHVYREGLKVAELKVTDFTRDINAAADIVAGECRVGDEVRVQ